MRTMTISRLRALSGSGVRVQDNDAFGFETYTEINIRTAHPLK
jgi:hypothetical protein